jgi:hypothetical protein
MLYNIINIWGADLSITEAQIIALPLIILGVVLLAIGLILIVGPQLASIVRGMGVPEPLRVLLIVGWKIGSIEVYTSPIMIVALIILYIAILRR